MVEVVCTAPRHATCHDRPPGHMGGPYAPGRPLSGPDLCGFSPAHWYLHPDGCSTRGYYSPHQTGEIGLSIKWDVYRSAVFQVNKLLLIL